MDASFSWAKTFLVNEDQFRWKALLISSSFSDIKKWRRRLCFKFCTEPVFSKFVNTWKVSIYSGFLTSGYCFANFNLHSAYDFALLNNEYFLLYGNHFGKHWKVLENIFTLSFHIKRDNRKTRVMSRFEMRGRARNSPGTSSHDFSWTDVALLPKPKALKFRVLF